jgi:signal transduction histidine kinase
LTGQQLAVSVNFVALGVNLLGAILLLLLNAGSRSVRWYLPFHLCVLLWLLSQGADLVWPDRGWLAPHAFAVAIMPLMFLVFAIMDGNLRPAWHAYLLLLAAAPVIPLVMRGIHSADATPFTETLVSVWSVIGWVGGSLILWLNGRRQVRAAPERVDVRRKVLLLSLVLIGPLSVAFAILVGGQWFVLIGVPIITILIMIMTFYGITRLQFYDIEVRARRTGEIAAETFETQRLAVLGELAATIAHEVRNPLTGMSSLAQRIARADVPAEKSREYAAVILDETARVEKLVSNLLDVARRGSRPRTAAGVLTPLAPVVADVVLLVDTRARRKSVHLTTHIQDGLAACAPRELITQALLNLLLNAIEHAPAGSEVVVRGVRAGSDVELIVADRGPGVSAHERERIFQPFYSTRPDGTGLGLSVLRHLAREQNWRVSVNDTPGGGAAFHVVIPACAS